jgi:hydrogenase nickel incorporation protein HypB
MCAVCGCGQDNTGADQKFAGTGHAHDHSHHHHSHHHYGQNAAGTSVAGFNDSQLIEIEESILSKNDLYAEANRRRFADQRLLALNLVSSPGAGKTTLLVETVRAIRDKVSVGVIEGDQETANDADRIRATGVEAVQINTGRGCHLDAHMVGHALDDLPLLSGGVVFIENVGNLVCPAAFDLGEAAKVVILSVTEGDDKPLKYPDMFAAAGLMILSKIDLLDHVDFDPCKALERARRINPQLHCLRLSARDGSGMAQWLDWIVERAAAAPAGSVIAPGHSDRRVSTGR